MIRIENGKVTVMSEDGRYSISASERFVDDLRDTWGIDFEKYVGKNFKVFAEIGMEDGEYSWTFSKNMYSNTFETIITLSKTEQNAQQKKELVNG